MNKNLLGISALIIALSISYYFVIFNPHKENQNTLIQKQEEEKKQQRENWQKLEKEKNKKARDKCLVAAKSKHHDNWLEECRIRGLLTGECAMTLDEYLIKHNLPAKGDQPISSLSARAIKAVLDYSWMRDMTDKCNCSLPPSISDQMNDDLEYWEYECYLKYPQK